MNIAIIKVQIMTKYIYKNVKNPRKIKNLQMIKEIPIHILSAYLNVLAQNHFNDRMHVYLIAWQIIHMTISILILVQKHVNQHAVNTFNILKVKHMKN